MKLISTIFYKNSAKQDKEDYKNIFRFPEKLKELLYVAIQIHNTVANQLEKELQNKLPYYFNLTTVRGGSQDTPRNKAKATILKDSFEKYFFLLHNEQILDVMTISQHILGISNENSAKLFRNHVNNIFQFLDLNFRLLEDGVVVLNDKFAKKINVDNLLW